jgi:hypothetical protein
VTSKHGDSCSVTAPASAAAPTRWRPQKLMMIMVALLSATPPVIGPCISCARCRACRGRRALDPMAVYSIPYRDWVRRQALPTTVRIIIFRGSDRACPSYQSYNGRYGAITHVSPCTCISSDGMHTSPWTSRTEWI